MNSDLPLHDLLQQIKSLREARGVTTDELEEQLILGPGWIKEFEEGKTVPRLDVFLAIINRLKIGLEELDFSKSISPDFVRNLEATQSSNNLVIAFPYGKYQARYQMSNALESQFEEILLTLRNGLAGIAGEDEEEASQIKANAVANSYLKAVRLWPHVNPSDLWWFLVYRAFLDPYNHPASWAKLNLDQSWKRTGGWALEKVLVQHYRDALHEKGIKLFIAENETKRRLISQIQSVSRIEADKADVLLTTETEEGEVLFGVVHVKASFAERRTDDVPLSKDLIEAGYYSPLWTMDCKSSPAARPVNKGELGLTMDGSVDRRSAKRKDIEDDGFFSDCFSYNANTLPTPSAQRSKSRITVLDFNNPHDAFYESVLAARDNFISKLN